MKYLIVGAGGIGGTIVAFLGKAGKDVTLLARGENLAALQKNGLVFVRDTGEEVVSGVKCVSEDEYREHPDVVFLCTKSYSVAEVAPFLARVCDQDTVIIPLLNGIEIGEMIREHIHVGRVLEGCIYIFAWKDGPGRIYLSGTRMIIVFGGEGDQSRLSEIAEDAFVPGMRIYRSENIKRDTLRKFTTVGAMAATGLYYDCGMGRIQEDEEVRAFFAECVREIVRLGEAMDLHFDEDLVQKNLDVVDHSAPSDNTSVQRDLATALRLGRDLETSTEISIFVDRPIQLGEQYGVRMKTFEMVREKLAKCRGKIGVK